jgi:hypothetical protein
MPAIVIAVVLVVLLIHSLGWWLLAIVGLLLALAGLWLYIDSQEVPKANSFGSVHNALPARHPPRTITIEIKSVSIGRKGSRTPSKEPAMPNDLMPCVALVIHSDPLDKILSGRKTWEMRTQNTNKRGPIALAKKGSGHIYGIADIVDSRGPMTTNELATTTNLHGITPARLADPQVAKYRYAWVLSNVRRLPQPVPYSHTKGAQSFVRLDRDTTVAIRAACGVA